jgi:hypothetical protein
MINILLRQKGCRTNERIKPQYEYNNTREPTASNSGQKNGDVKRGKYWNEKGKNTVRKYNILIRGNVKDHGLAIA